MKRLELNGVDMAEVTLHTGLGTIRSIEVEDLSKHRMDAEFYMVNNQAVETINTALDAGKRICSIGTTSMRAIESSVSAYGRLKEGQGWTNLFVYPPFEFSIANSMLTNFHLPKSSLIIMVCAFGGYDLIMKAYEEAIKEKYRFYSYGDAMLISLDVKLFRFFLPGFLCGLTSFSVKAQRGFFYSHIQTGTIHMLILFSHLLCRIPLC